MRKARILMLEDETNVLTINQEYLEARGFEVHCASTIAQARPMLLQAPDLILLDVMLPDGMSWDFSAEIRVHTNAPIIYLTCRDDNESVIKGLMSSGDDYITKPYDLNVLGARVTTALRRSGFAMAGIIEAPPLTIDMLSGVAMLGGEKIHLSQREIQLLAFLAISAGRYVKCEDIYRRVWGEPVADYHKTIAVYISYLRQKLNLAENGLFEIRSNSEKEYMLSRLVY